MMSLFHNGHQLPRPHSPTSCPPFTSSIGFPTGVMRTMKANYHPAEGDLRVVRPMIYVRERLCTAFAKLASLPIIHENCPACFEAPKERAR